MASTNDDDEKKAVEFAEAFLQGAVQEEQESIDEPKDLLDACRIVDTSEAKHGSFCERFAHSSDVLIAFVHAIRSEYQESHDMRHKLMAEEMENLGLLLAETHEANHVYRSAIEDQLNREAD